MRLFAACAGAAGLIAPIAWNFILKPYQKTRVTTFLNPESDPLGAGYHVIQSKIAIGSGGFWGKGLFQGTQSHLNFLPEKHTDFIFSVAGEELGFIGSTLILLLYARVIYSSFYASMHCRYQFGRLSCMGISFLLFSYIFINLSMISGMMPVVGVPLPLLSYGGSATLSICMATGFLLSVSAHKEAWRAGLGDI